jgi:hypothetical protein
MDGRFSTLSLLVARSAWTGGVALVLACIPARGAEDLAALGWTPAPPPPACEIVQPPLSPVEAARLATQSPQALPRPLFRCADASVELPVLRDPALLQRAADGAAAVTWAVQATGRLRGRAASVRFDVAPYEAPRADPSEFGRFGADAGPHGRPLLQPPRVVRDPALHGRASKYNKAPEPLAAPHQPELQAVPVQDVAEDALLATPDGSRWLALRMTGDQWQARFGLRPERVFGGNGRLLVAPRAIQLDAATALLAVDAATGAVRSLGRPAPKEAGAFLRVTDARDRDGRVEALVAVDEIAQGGLTSPYGLLAVLEAGTWTFPERWFTPAERGVLPELLFDAADPEVVHLVSGEVHATRPLRSAPVPAAP